MRARPVGVEEELLVVDPDSGVPLGVAAAVIDRAQHSGDEAQGELQRQQVEIASAARRSMHDIGEDLRRRRCAVGRAAAEVGAAVAALATSPHAVDPQVSDDARYQRMVARFGLLAREQLTCGCHVHVEVDGDEEGVAVIDRIRPWMPVLRALSANSPYWQGVDTGFAGYRHQVWDRWPTAGPTEIFGSAAGYHRAVSDVLNTATVLDEGMIYSGDTEMVQVGLDSLRQRGNGAAWQRSACDPDLDPAELVRAAVAITNGEEPDAIRSPSTR